jgi:alpha-tubulin suppressor-like RCC1 family protein
VSWRGASPDSGFYSLQWVRVGADGAYNFNTYTMWSVRGTSTNLPNWFAAGATYALRVFTMRADWDGLAHSNQNVTPHSAIVTFTLPACESPLSLSYLNSEFSSVASSETLAPTVGGGEAVSFSYSGSLPTGVTFNTSTGVFTGSAAWNFQATQIDSSNDHSCALTTRGAVKCWGKNEFGQLGNGTLVNSSTPVDVVGLASGVSRVMADGNMSCAVTTAGGVKCWGLNDRGQLGDGTQVDRSSPVDMVGYSSGVSTTVAGDSFICLLTTSGGVKCLGFNSVGELGRGALTPVFDTVPADVSGLTSGVESVSAGWNHVCARLTAGGVKCWGGNAEGQLGNGSTTDSSSPVDVSGLFNFASISAGPFFTCGVTTAGGAKCWGRNDEGQIGDNSITDRTTPVDVSGLTSGVDVVSAGNYHTCALTTAGGAKCWGNNVQGQLGDGTISNRPVPGDVTGLTSGVSLLSAGHNFVCARDTSYVVKCWGLNNNGQLGDGTTTSRLTAVSVTRSGENSGFPATITVTMRTSNSDTVSTSVRLTIN